MGAVESMRRPGGRGGSLVRAAALAAGMAFAASGAGCANVLPGGKGQPPDRDEGRPEVLAAKPEARERFVRSVPEATAEKAREARPGCRTADGAF